VQEELIYHLLLHYKVPKEFWADFRVFGVEGSCIKGWLSCWLARELVANSLHFRSLECGSSVHNVVHLKSVEHNEL
jgi:hypothetical protein